jgi:tRNA (cmo5U34)-methyltransferase
MTAADNTTTYSAGEYEDGVRKTIPYYAFFHEEAFDFVRAASANEPKEWLDTGGGTGTLIEKALKQFPQTRFTLADPSPAMLEQAEKKFAGEKRVLILPPVGSAQLPSEFQGQFDVVSAIQCHHYLKREERRQAVVACRRMLKPGGIFLAFENIRHESDMGMEFAIRRWISFQTSQGKSESEARIPVERINHNTFPITVAEHLALLRECDFADAGQLWFAQMQAGFWAVR